MKANMVSRMLLLGAGALLSQAAANGGEAAITGTDPAPMGLRGLKQATPSDLSALPARVGRFAPPGIYPDGTARGGKRVEGHVSRTATTEPGSIDLADCRKGLPPAQVVQTFESGYVITNKVVKITGVTATGKEYDWCSGTLVAPRVIATAGHCVYDPDTGSYFAHVTGSLLDHFNIYIQYNSATGDKFFQKRETVAQKIFEDFRNLPSWVDSLDQGSDLAVLQLASAFGGGIAPAPWGGVATGSTGMRTVVGFPAVVQNGEEMIMDTTTDPVVRDFAHVTSTKLSNEGGMSGGPTFAAASNLLIAVTSGAYIDACPGLYTDVNSNKYPLKTLVAAFAKVTCTGGVCKAD